MALPPFIKYTEWINTELLPLPSQQMLPGDEIVIIRGGVPFRYDPVTRFAEATMAGNALATTINVMDQWESIAGVLVDSGIDTGLSLAGNVYTVTAETSLFPIHIEAGVTIMKVGGGTAANFEIGIFVNGIHVGVGQVGLASSAQWGNANVAKENLLATGDTVEIKIRNRTDADNVVVSEMRIGIK